MSDPGAAVPAEARRASGAVLERLTTLAALLRAGGVRVGTGEIEAGARALTAIDPSQRGDVYLAVLRGGHELLPMGARLLSGVQGEGLREPPLPLAGRPGLGARAHEGEPGSPSGGDQGGEPWQQEPSREVAGGAEDEQCLDVLGPGSPGASRTGHHASMPSRQSDLVP